MDHQTSIHPQIPVSYAEIARFCRRHHIRKLALFGSVLRDDFGPESDVDVLIEFEPDAIIGLKYIRIQDELSALFRRPVDMCTPGSLSRHFRNEVVDSAETIYEQRG